VRWSGTDNPNICVEVSDDGFSASIKIFEVSGVLTGRVQRVACGADLQHAGTQHAPGDCERGRRHD